MLVLYALKEAYQSLYTHKSRTLSMGFGISWAIFILLLLLGVGHGFHNGASQRFAKFGERSIFIGGIKCADGRKALPLEVATNFPKWFKTIGGHAAPVRATYAPQLCAYSDTLVASYKGTISSYLYGVKHDFPLYRNHSIAEGRFFTSHDEAEVSNLCIISHKTKERLFGKASAIGQYIGLGSNLLQVVGVLEDSPLNDGIFLTYTFFEKFFPMKPDISYMHLSLLPTVQEALVESQCRSYLARYLNVDANNILLWNVAQEANKLHSLFKTISIFIWIIGVCFLITAMVTMSNMMLVTIQERRQEITIRRVLGGRSKEIMAMIICEGAIVAFIAGIIGFAAGFAFFKLLNQWVVPLLSNYQLSALTCPSEVIVSGLGLTLLTSSLASMIPTIRALKIKPIQALNSL